MYPEDVVLLMGYGRVWCAASLATTHRRRYATKQVLETVTTKKVPKGNTSTVALQIATEPK